MVKNIFICIVFILLFVGCKARNERYRVVNEQVAGIINYQNYYHDEGYYLSDSLLDSWKHTPERTYFEIPSISLIDGIVYNDKKEMEDIQCLSLIPENFRDWLIKQNVINYWKIIGDEMDDYDSFLNERNKFLEICYIGSQESLNYSSLFILVEDKYKNAYDQKTIFEIIYIDNRVHSILKRSLEMSDYLSLILEWVEQEGEEYIFFRLFDWFDMVYSEETWAHFAQIGYKVEISMYYERFKVSDEGYIEILEDHYLNNTINEK